MIEITDLRCVRNEEILFQKVSFVVNPGEALQILGPNGIGKSTLLRAIAARQRPGSFCYIGHKHNLHSALTVSENLHFLQALLPHNSKDNAGSLHAALEYFGMQRSANKPSHELSAGQLQRVSLARLALTTAKLWLLDEPAANLDAAAQQLFISLCERHLRNAGMIICATHNIFEFSAANATIIRLQEYA
jgi:heme exporter protein A